MKRIALIVGLLVFLLLLAVVVISPDANAPRFEKISGPVVFQPPHQIAYDFLNPRPFEGGRMWILTSPGQTNRQVLVYDIDHKKALGRLLNGWPVLLLAKESKMLCVQPVSRPWRWLEPLLRFADRATGGRIGFRPLSGDAQRYWLVDLEKNSATRIGDLPAHPNTSFYPSSDFRYAYTALHRGGLLDVYCFDLERHSLQRLEVAGWPSGWWDHNRMLVLTTNNDFVLYNFSTQATAPFLGAGRIAEFFRQSLLSADPALTRPFFFWNGHENDFYLTEGNMRWQAAESYLIKVERPDGKLKLLSPRFKFEWSDHLDPTDRYYLYSGRTPGDGSDGVFVRDLQSGTNRVLVVPDSDKYFSIPQFYWDSVIYIRSNMLWQISFDGSNNVRLFPPPRSAPVPASKR